MSIDITGLSAKELDALINQAKKRKTTLVKRKPIAAVRKRLSDLAKAEGYTIAELFGGTGPKAAAARPTTTGTSGAPSGARRAPPPSASASHRCGARPSRRRAPCARRAQAGGCGRRAARSWHGERGR
jgi:DNA-binding protein H-NS